MSVFDWIDMARALDADGLEMYEGFFTSLDDAYLARVRDAIAGAGFEIADALLLAGFHQPRRRSTQARGRA